MNIEDIITALFPYLSSFRKIKTYLSIDLIFPQNWEFPNELINQVQAVQNEKYTGQGSFISFACELSSMMSTLTIIFEIINHNLAREEKEKLLREKVSELKQLFEKQTLSDLKNLTIRIPESDPIEDLIEHEED
jgi:hypothetical protein